MLAEKTDRMSIERRAYWRSAFGPVNSLKRFKPLPFFERKLSVDPRIAAVVASVATAAQKLQRELLNPDSAVQIEADG